MGSGPAPSCGTRPYIQATLRSKFTFDERCDILIGAEDFQPVER
jgi:hypothetical protein